MSGEVGVPCCVRIPAHDEADVIAEEIDGAQGAIGAVEEMAGFQLAALGQRPRSTRHRRPRQSPSTALPPLAAPRRRSPTVGGPYCHFPLPRATGSGEVVRFHPALHTHATEAARHSHSRRPQRKPDNCNAAATPTMARVATRTNQEDRADCSRAFEPSCVRRRPSTARLVDPPANFRISNL